MMIEYLKFRWRLHQLLREKDKTQLFYFRKIKKMELEKRNQSEIDVLISEAFHERNFIDEEISLITTVYLTRCASRNLLPLPDYGDDSAWIKCQFQNRYVLTNERITALRSALRNEAKECRDMFLPWVALGIGLIGSMTGLISVIVRH